MSRSTAGPEGDGAEGAEAADDGAAAPPGAESLDGPLPEKVRHRVVRAGGAAFAGLRLSELPAALRQYARFTFARRIKYGGRAIASALETDTVFRQRVAAHLRSEDPELAGALEDGTVPPAADPVEVASTAYVLRPPGWVKLVSAAGEQLARQEAELAQEERDREMARLQAEVTRLRESGRTEVDRLRHEAESARKEADGLHRKLRAAQSDVRRGEAALRKVRAELEENRTAAQRDRDAAEVETRRLRARLAEAEAAVDTGRRAAREGRGIEEARLRLLLDTVLEAAQGLRRELALPPSEFRPAQMVEAAEPGGADHRDVAERGLSRDDPARLDQLLALPQVHLVVDGYNVTKTGYPTLPLEKQRLRLLGGLASLAAQTAAEVTCVFDGADLDVPVLLAPPRGVRVLFSRSGRTADDLIRELARAEPPGRPVVVVSTDREVADGVARSGARPVASAMLLRRLERG